MRLLKQQYKDRHGNLQESAKWYVQFKDHTETWRRLPAFKDRKPSQELGRKLESMVVARSLNQSLDLELSRWLETMPADLRQRLAKWGILDGRAVSQSEPLTKHLEDFHSSLIHKGGTQAHADLVKGRAERVRKGCGFVFYSDISPSKVQRYLADLRKGSKDETGISHQTSNFYLQAIKQFCRWMVRDGRATESPVQHLDGLNVQLDRRHDRRNLTAEELKKLIETTATGPVRHKLDGTSRAMLYRVAMETGFRRNELRSLTPASLELKADPPCIVLAPKNSKNRQPVVQVIRPELAEELGKWLKTSQKAPESPLWKNLTQHTSKMLKADLEAAEIAYVDESGRFADFHALRHSYVSLITKGGVHPKIAQRLARHSTVELTLARYSHTVMADEAKALEVLPSMPSAFSPPESENQELRATGTDGTGENVLHKGLHKLGTSDSISVHQPALSEGAETIPFMQPEETKKARETRGFPLPRASSQCGEGEIRTRGTVSGTPVFKTGERIA